MNLPEAGLDFAPFIDAQGNVGPYAVGEPVIAGEKAVVPVEFGKDADPKVQIELQLVGKK